MVALSRARVFLCLKLSADLTAWPIGRVGQAWGGLRLGQPAGGCRPALSEPLLG